MREMLRGAGAVLAVWGVWGMAGQAQQPAPAEAARVAPILVEDAGLGIRMSGQTIRRDGRQGGSGFMVPADPSYGTHERALSTRRALRFSVR